MPQTKWHLNHNLHLSCCCKQTLVLTTKPLLLKKEVTDIEFVAEFICGQLSRRIMVRWTSRFGRHRMAWSFHSSQAAKTRERTGSFYHRLHPLCLQRKGSKRPHSFKRIQDNRVEELPHLQRCSCSTWKTAALQIHNCDELKAHEGMPCGSQMYNAKAATVGFFFFQPA